MTFKPHGKHLIAGEWVGTAQTFLNEPADPAQEPHVFSMGNVDLVERACAAAEDAFWSYGYSSREERAAFLDAIADEIDARGEQITWIGCLETGLPPARLNGERGRTVGQLRLFATHIRDGAYLDRRHDAALPDRQPMPRPDLRLLQRPIGPVAVFGASNFPLAFSVAGGDTAAALAAGCPVVVKGHSAHPGTSEIVAEAIHAARKALNLHEGVFSLVQGGRRDVGSALVCHPLIKAVGFTGSLAGGRALFDLCAARPEPIPFFGELGSINPLFVLNAAVDARGPAIGAGLANSLTGSAGQLCTKPGLAVVPKGPAGDALVAAAVNELAKVPAQVLLTSGMCAAYHKGKAAFAAHPAVRVLVDSSVADRRAGPDLYEVDYADFIADEHLSEEVFGPFGLIVRVDHDEAMIAFAKTLTGQLTATLHMEDADADTARKLAAVLERKAGRLLVNGFPTGVEVVDSMVHSGPYPASTNFGATSVGTMAIRRFLRPICYQNLPQSLLVGDLA